MKRVVFITESQFSCDASTVAVDDRSVQRDRRAGRNRTVVFQQQLIVSAVDCNTVGTTVITTKTKEKNKNKKHRPIVAQTHRGNRGRWSPPTAEKGLIRIRI